MLFLVVDHQNHIYTRSAFKKSLECYMKRQYFLSRLMIIITGGGRYWKKALVVPLI